MINLIILISGFIPLILGASLLVDNASSLAKKFNIPNMVIGLTIVAFGTSAPELIVNVFSSINGNSDITMGNVIGSNILNIAVILGISSIIYPLSVKTNTTWIEIPLAFLSSLVIFVMANDTILDSQGISYVTRSEGIILLFFFIIFMVYNAQLMKTGSFSEEITIKERELTVSILLIIAGIALLVTGGKLIVDNAVAFAKTMKISERIIGLTIVSFGTSLPELATSAVGAWKKNVDIAIGNVVGSNIFNVFFILGISAIIKPVPIKDGANIDLIMNMIVSAMLFLFIFTGKGRKLERVEGTVFLFMYTGYLFLIL